ncbi:hypothetical protein BDV23DRAFT_195447 [Aspergillus alliaceus]|uniref:Uncharacterized protein n=1 Tax=Petromyces alliaceus TaxID=209559 RepID=A0A5N6FRS2_PETAA|nr:uncharacterized protein BDW43DRAFT_320538 [Aspergillus alliaceus]KAB8231875.1 hypothetical protein BDW43DRAFT_320538 [Aspergillus alliaceus]KAE8388042.1 hypothetical protein BDV23DRAFT_195447 [Aspergillus alliaceus]
MQLPPNPYWPETPRQQGPFPSMSSFCQHLPSVGEAPGSSNPYYPAQTPTPTPQNPHLMRQPRAARTPLPAPVAQHAVYYGPLEPLYPAFYPTGVAPVSQVVGNETQGQPERFEQIPDLKKPFHTVALSEEMPIGSHVHTSQAPRWGVIKISNIPYSVTKYEISQFVGRQARLITPDKGCSIHIIMERSTAKTMDCFAETETHEAARETVKRINSIYESGRAPRLGLRRVEVELSSQDALLKELFPKAKCISWEDGMPSEISSTDPYSTGFSGFITSEEIVGAIRHAEIPHRFPWYATKLYTVDDRNQLFEMANRHLLSLASRIEKTHTMGLDQNLLRDLLYAGLNCPAFNERQKYTLCVNSGLEAEIARFPEISKWFPFDTLVQLPNYNKDALLYYSNLISKGTIPDHGIPHLTNTFPQDRNDLRSPYGRVWFEWPGTITKTVLWESAVQIEMHILGNLVLTGWVSKNNETRAAAEPSSSTRQRARETTVHSITSPDEGPIQQSSSRLDIFATPSRHAAEVRASCDPETEASPSRRPFNDSDESPWTRRLLIFPPGPAREGFHFGHRTTKSSPSQFPGSSA